MVALLVLVFRLASWGAMTAVIINEFILCICLVFKHVLCFYILHVLCFRYFMFFCFICSDYILFQVSGMFSVSVQVANKTYYQEYNLLLAFF